MQFCLISGCTCTIHKVGFHVDVECATGFYRTKDSPLDVTCFANLKYVQCQDT